MAPPHDLIPSQFGQNDVILVTNACRSLATAEAYLQGRARLWLDQRHESVSGRGECLCALLGVPFDCFLGERGCQCDSHCLEARRACLDDAGVTSVSRFWGNRLDRAALKLQIAYEPVVWT